MRLPWYICESDDRWEIAVRSFASQLCRATDDYLTISTSHDLNVCRTELEKQPRAVVIWELPPDDATSMLEAIDQLVSRRRDILQLVALAPEANASQTLRTNLELALREIGIASVLTDILALPRLAPLVQKFWQQGRDGGNLSTVHDIWDRLPWAKS